ncbi:hypothetical protein TYRP_012358 [Tyrophagus putrescentiae]|nr:hypothetical protein TYRP_012358 [Tyrophagus putrescentiae]
MAPTPALRAEDHHHHHHTITARTPVSMLQPMATRPRDDSGPMTTRMDFEDGWRRRPTATKTDDNQDGWLPGWTTARMDDQDGRRRRLKTEDRRLKTDDGAEEAVNRTVDLPKRQSTLAVDLLKRWGTPAINGAQLVLGASRPLFPPCTFAGSLKILLSLLGRGADRRGRSTWTVDCLKTAKRMETKSSAKIAQDCWW